ncbi:PREDICTED: ribonuclease UK114 isoform X2 [Gekko japonicus]|uniref:Ribonuclease UK114 isoform X2 n=1 Tax=Gekko japonicus TaxID=146911 RepID=A0ABM1JIR1_GEKJA|nr:PREDICTED: ribonuclease UK114 isoform X2 [Gekko japonicus]
MHCCGLSSPFWNYPFTAASFLLPDLAVTKAAAAANPSWTPLYSVIPGIRTLGYVASSQAVLVDRTMYIAGQIGMDPSSGQLVPGGVKEQTKQALKNMGEILKVAYCDYGNVVKTTVLMADMKDFDDMNEVYKQFFEGDFPARAAYQVAALPKGARVEIEAVAISGPLCDAKHDTRGNL